MCRRRVFLALSVLSVAAAVFAQDPTLKNHPALGAEPTLTGAAAEPVPTKAPELFALLRRANGLDLSGSKAWHLRAHYEVFNALGLPAETGTFEETYVNPHSFKRSYISDKIKQTDVTTPSGIFRTGDQKWPGFGAESVATLVADPFAFGSDPKGHSLMKGQHIFGQAKFDCVLIRPFEDINTGLATKAGITPDVLAATSPAMAYAQYCMDPGHSMLRYSSLEGGASAVTYNSTMLFQGRFLARDLMVVNEKLKRLSIHVETFDEPTPAAIAALAAPAGATGPLPAHVILTSSGYPHSTRHDQPDLPAVARKQQIRGGFVVVNLTLSPSGHVISVEPLTGQEILYPAAIEGAMKWQFKPVLIKGQPIEAEMVDMVIFGGR